MEIAPVVIAALLGTILGGFVLALPGVGAAGLAAVLLARFGTDPRVLAEPELLFIFFSALTVSGSFASIIPAFFFSAPGPATVFLTVPGERCRSEGRSLRGALDAGRGCLAGVLLLAALSPLFLYLYEPLQMLVFRHLRWAAAVLVVWMLGGEAVFHLRRARGERRKTRYRALRLAPLIFLLAGILGLLAGHCRRFPAGGSRYAALIGLFLIPPLVRRILAPEGAAPKKETSLKPLPDEPFALSGALAGGAGGLLAALLPGIGAGPGALVAGHLAPGKRERAFLFSQGMVQSLLAATAFLVFFLPARPFIRSQVSRTIAPYHQPGGFLASYILIAGVILASGALAYLIFHLTARLARTLTRGVSPRLLSAAIVLFVTGLTCLLYGPGRLPVFFTGICLGSLPLVFGCRRSNLFGFFLLPYLIFLAGWHEPLSALLGLR